MLGDLKVSIKADALLKAARVARRFIRENGRYRVSADGRPLPPNVDLKDTGELFQNVDFRTQEGKALIIFRAPHASIVEQKYHFAGIPPQRWDDFLKELAPIFAEGARLVKG